jgi:predicted nucleotidyltransferase
MNGRRKRDDRSESIEKTDTVASHEGLERQTEASKIIHALKAHLPHLLQGRPVLLAYAYGSVAADTMTPFSDVDIALVLADESLPPREQLRLQLDLSIELTDVGIAGADVRIINQAPLGYPGPGGLSGHPALLRGRGGAG